jgi:hypothetical protein
MARDGSIGSKEGIGKVRRGAARWRRREWRGSVAMPAEEGEMRGIYRRGSAPG